MKKKEMKKTILYCFLGFILGIKIIEAKFNRICYYDEKSQNRVSGGEFYPEDIDPKLCTHIVYGHALVKDNHLIALNEDDVEIDSGAGMYDRLTALRIINPDLKVLLSIGDGSADELENIAKSDELLQKFAENVSKFLKKWNFNGLNLNWANPSTKKRLTKLVDSIITVFNIDTILSSADRLMLTVTVGVKNSVDDSVYEVEKLSKIVDLVLLRAFNIHDSSESKINFHSALNDDSSSSVEEISIDSAVQFWLDNGCPKEKLVLGVAAFGRGFKLAEISENSVGSKSTGPSSAGKYTERDGFLSYFEVCDLLKNPISIKKFDASANVPSVQVGLEWIGYENMKSITVKANYIKKNCLGGFLLWSIDLDDVSGKFCSQGPSPLLNSLNKALSDEKCGEDSVVDTIDDTTISTSTRSTTTPSKKESDSKSATCSKTEMLPSLDDCHSFHLCLKNFPEPITTIKCPKSFWFDKTVSTCVENRPDSCGVKDSSVVESQPIDQRPSEAVNVSPVENKKEVKSESASSFTCPKDNGYFADKNDCTKFWQCANKIAYSQKCTAGLSFNEEIGNCNFDIKKNCPQADALLEYNPSDFSCPSDGMFQKVDDCAQFWHCSNDIAYLIPCPLSTFFDSKTQKCEDISSTCH